MDVVLWILVILLYINEFMKKATPSLSLTRIIVGMLLKIARGQVLDSRDMNTLQELDETLKKRGG